MDHFSLAEIITAAIAIGMRLLGASVILIGGWVIGNWVNRRIHNIKRLDDTLSGFLGAFAKYIILAMAGIAVLGEFGVQTASLLAVLGAAGLAIGLALQGTLSNVASGTMLLILRPFKVGDLVGAGGKDGYIKSLGLFGTVMHTLDNTYIFVPNSQIWNSEIINYTRLPQRRQDINFSISYNDDIGKAIAVVRSVLESDDRIIQNDKGRKPDAHTVAMGASSVDLIARFWFKPKDYWDLKWDITRAIKEALDTASINIPFPTQTLYMISDAGNENTMQDAPLKNKETEAQQTH